MQSTWNENSYCAFFQYRIFCYFLCYKRSLLTLTALGHLLLILIAHMNVYRHPYTKRYFTIIFHVVKTFCYTPQKMTMSHTKERRKEKKTHLTIWLAFGVHNIFISYFFPLFFSLSLFVSFHHFLPLRVCVVVVLRCIGGK